MPITATKAVPIALPADVRKALADEYASLRYSPQAKPAFTQLHDHADAQVHAHQLTGRRIALRDRIVQTNFTDHNPYHAFEELRYAALIEGNVDFDAKGTDYNHPFWTGYEMATYMVWHDLMGHVETGLDFTPEGELALFTHHAHELLDSGDLLAVPALFMEIVYRVSWINTYGWTWKYKPVLPGPLAQHVMDQVLTGQPVTMPERHATLPRHPWHLG